MTSSITETKHEISPIISIIKPIIIYLERNYSRMNNVLKLYYQLPNTIIFPAIDGNLINFKSANSKTDNQPDNSTVFINYRNLLFPHNPTIRLKKELLMGYEEAGCLLSHVMIWDYLFRTLKDNELGLILEDDAVCIDENKFKELIPYLPPHNEWDLCHLFTTTKFNNINITKDYGKFYSINPIGINRASSYLITKHGCRCLLGQLQSLDLPADDIITESFKNKTLRLIFPKELLWTHLEEICNDDCSRSSLWTKEAGHLYVKWDRPISNSWIGMEIGAWTGIGNQMFQYAALKSISLEKRIHCVIKPVHKFMLSRYFSYIRNWQEYIGANDDSFNSSLRNINKVNVDEWNNAEIWSEKKLEYNNSIWDISRLKNYRLDGYLQSIKYFENIIPLLRLIFDFDITVKDRCRKTLDRLFLNNNDPVIAIHIRLPDNPNESVYNFEYSFATTDFIYNSINYFIAKYPTANFIVCSNDVPRGKTIYDFSKFKNRIEWVTLGLIEDMCLMTLCDHFIISASTYSWWSAVLCCKKDKEIITCTPFLGPKNSLGNEKHNIALSNWKVYDMVNNKLLDC